MSALRQCLKNPKIYLCLLAAVLLLATVDSFRAPSSQLTARVYVGLVRHVYQTAGRPIAKRWAQCRYVPTCSDYSIAAVSTHGIRRGLVLTMKRLMSCKASVPLGTVDPVPD